MKSIRIRIRAAQTAAILATTTTLCVLGLPLQAQIYTSYVFQGTSDGTTPLGFGGTNFVGVIDAPMPPDSLTPNYHFNNNQEQYTNPDNGITTTFTASAAAASKGIWGAGMSASGSITNGYFPTGAVGTKTPPFGYYVQSAFGSASSVTFFTGSDPIVNAQSQMHWHVSGTENATLGRANSRLDFAVTTNPVSSVFDIFNPGIATPLEAFGFGNYSYTAPITIGQTQNFLFWSSAFYEVDPGDLPNTPQNFSGFIDASNTFNLDSIDLLDSSGDPIPDWTLVDNGTGNVLWNQSGRVTAATPEPGSVALLTAFSITGMAFLRQRHRKKSLPK